MIGSIPIQGAIHKEGNLRFLHVGKDGGEYSKVWGLFVVEIKKLFSFVMMCFEDGSREAYHTHAFNSISWVVKGKLVEHHLNGKVRS